MRRCGACAAHLLTKVEWRARPATVVLGHQASHGARHVRIISTPAVTALSRAAAVAQATWHEAFDDR